MNVKTRLCYNTYTTMFFFLQKSFKLITILVTSDCFWRGFWRRCAFYVRACDVRRNVSATLQLIDVISWCNGTRLVTSHGCLRQALWCGSVAKVQKAAATEPAGSGQRFWHGRGRRRTDRRPTASRRWCWRPGERRRHCRAEWRLWLWRRSCQ